MGKNCHDHKHVEIPSYWHSLDGDSYKNSINRFTAKNLSVSTPPFENQLNALRTRIKQGVNNIELGFMGVGKGSAQSPTPGSVGMAERQAIKEVAKINDVKINSIHAPMSIQGLAGFTQNGFNEQQRFNDVEEVKRSIDFAGDVTNGGAIVVHTGEFPYSVKEKFGDKPFVTKDGKKIKLSESPYAAEYAKQYIVDKRGQVTQAIDKNYFNNKFEENIGDGNAGIVKRDMNFYFDLAKKNENDLSKKKNFQEYKITTGKELDDYEYKRTYLNPYWLANKESFDFQEINMKTKLREYEDKYEDDQNLIKRYKDMIKDVEDNLKMSDRQIIENLELRNEVLGEVIPPNKEKYIEKGRKKFRSQLKNLKEELHKQQRKNTYLDDIYEYKETIKDQKMERYLSRSIGDYGMDRTNESVAELAIEAAKVTKDRKLDKSLFVAPENLWDGNYGSHPKDLKEIIQNSRKKFIDFALKDQIEMNGKLVDNPYKNKIEKIHGKKLSEEDAKKYAKDHIKATFDIGHANIWRKYFEGSDEEFKQWIGTEIKDLTDNGIIGHVHVSDNFGYNDEHLAPGAGNAPIKEFMTHLEKSNYQGSVIIEPGPSDSQYPNFLTAMYDLETPVYRLHGDRTNSWTSIQGGYFGQGYIPSFVTNSYLSPADKNRPFTWSGVPLE